MSGLLQLWYGVEGAARGYVSGCAKLNTRQLVLATTVSSMSKTERPRSVPPIVAAVVQPVAKRLSRIEALLIEMRNEQDVLLKRFNALLARIDTLTEPPAKPSNKRGSRGLPSK
jgi:hypothetical protein